MQALGASAVQKISMLAIMIAMGMIALGSAATVEAQRTFDQANEDAIKQVIVEMTTGFNSHDGRAASLMYAPDAQLVTVRGEVMNGRAEIEKGLPSIFATRAKNATHRTLDVSVRFIRPDVALAHVTNELSGLVAPDGQALPAHQELSLRVLTKEDGQWRVAAFHNTMIRPFAATPK